MDNQFVGGPPQAQSINPAPPSPDDDNHDPKDSKPVEPVYSPNHVVTSPKKYSRHFFKSFLKLLLILALMAGAAYGGYKYENNKSQKTIDTLNAQVKVLNAKVKSLENSSSDSTAALKINADNSARNSDAVIVQQSVKVFTVSNNGTAPQTLAAGTAKELKICGSTCNSTSETVTLTFFDPSKVSIKAYADKLTTSDTNTLYIVTDATCSPQNELTAQAKSQAIIYANQTSTKALSHKCLAV